ncbi:MAG: hypothetical protein M1823_003506 [Watsoniomyces obsoletus]|nr:MAG: hypothetical protein M1823_003506 [Watsoniomyces obsoletus]
MPRPKRSKVGKAAPKPTPRAATPPRPTPPPSSNIPDATNYRDATSSDSDGLVIAKPGYKRRSGDDHYMMSGGLGPGEVRPPHATPRTKRRRIELSRIAREADHAKALEGLKKRRAEEEERRRNEEVKETKAKEHDDGESEKQSQMTELVEEEEGESEQQMEEKKTMMDSSMMVIANFKRRPRQPSILRMVQAEREKEKENDENDDDDNLGLDLDLDMEDFKPEDESTPFHVRLQVPDSQPERVVSPTTMHGDAEAGQDEEERPRTSSAKETPAKDTEGSTTPLDASRSRNVTLEDVSDVDLPNHGNSKVTEASPIPAHNPDLQRETTPVIWSDTMAPPASSSSSGHTQAIDATPKNHTRDASPSIPQSVKSTNKKTKKGSSSPRARQVQTKTKQAENRVTKSTQTRKKKTSLTTAALQDFLPRRRRRGQRQVRGNGKKEVDEFEIFSSTTSQDENEHDDDDEDGDYKVNNGHATRKMAKKGDTAIPAKTATKGVTKGKSTTTSSIKRATIATEEIATPSSPSPSPSLSSSSSNKENHPTPSAKLAALTRSKSKSKSTTTGAMTRASTTNGTKKAFDLAVSMPPISSASKVTKRSPRGNGNGNGNGNVKTPAAKNIIKRGIQKTDKNNKNGLSSARKALQSLADEKEEKGGREGLRHRKPLAPTNDPTITHNSDDEGGVTEHHETDQDGDVVMTDPDDVEENSATKTYSKQPAKTKKPTATKGKKNVHAKSDNATGMEGEKRIMTKEKKERDVSKELLEQGKKFQEVDQWELCFEDVTVSS